MKHMRIQKRFFAAAVAALLVLPGSSGAQVGVSVGCSPGIPSCASLRFFIDASGGVAINQLYIQLLSAPWQFTSGPTPAVGSYSATDSYGDFSGFSTIDPSTALAIDFTENGFPFEVFDGDTGVLDVEASGGSSTDGLYYRVDGVTVTGQGFSVSVTPEPSSAALFGLGLVLLAAAGAKRRRNAGH